MKKGMFLIMLIGLWAPPSMAMTGADVREAIIGIAAKHQEGNGGLMFEYHGVRMMMFADDDAGRMRIISPITSLREIDSSTIYAMLAANFHTALDARYAVSGDTVYAAFLHPLDNLTQVEIESAMTQVASLTLSFGHEYSSTGLTFGGEPD